MPVHLASLKNTQLSRQCYMLSLAFGEAVWGPADCQISTEALQPQSPLNEEQHTAADLSPVF